MAWLGRILLDAVVSFVRINAVDNSVIVFAL